MSTPLRDLTSIELGRRVMWDLMTLADYHHERERVARWRAHGLPLPSKWELGVDPRPTFGPTFRVEHVAIVPFDR
jgi:hypothetical protein